MLSNIFEPPKFSINPPVTPLVGFKAPQVAQPSQGGTEPVMSTITRGLTTAGKFAYAIPKYGARSALELGLSIPGIGSKVGEINPGEDFGPLGQKLLGDEPIQSVQDTYKQNLNTARSLGFGKTAPIISIIGALGEPALNLWFGGEGNGAYEEFVNTLVKETNPEAIMKHLVDKGVPEEVAREYAPKMGEVSDPTIIKKGLDEIANRVKPEVAHGNLAQEVSKYKNVEDFVNKNTDPYKMKGTPEEKTARDMDVQRYVYRNETPKQIPISDLKFNESRVIKEYQPSLDREVTDPIIIDKEGFVKDGHHRVAQAIANGDKTVLAFEQKSIEEVEKELTNFYNQVKTTAKDLTPVQEAEAVVKNILESTGKETPPSLATIEKNIPPISPSISEEAQASISKIVEALKEAKPIRAEQEALYTAERGKRLGAVQAVAEKTSGEKGFYQELAQLKGELPKAEYESIRNKITQADIDHVFDAVKGSSMLSEWDKIAARNGLVKMLEGSVPTQSEIRLLNRALGKQLAETLMDKMPLMKKIGSNLNSALNLPRTIMSSIDVSAPFRQGLFLLSHPKAFFGSFFKMFRQFGSEQAFKAVQESISKMPLYPLMIDNKLALSEIGTADLMAREERFMSNFADKIPGIKQSSRAYTGFLNKLRADVFTEIVNSAIKLGRDPHNDPALARQIADFVNIASGRGSFETLIKSVPLVNHVAPELAENMEKAVPFFNGIFFSPRLMASRLTLLNPSFYIKADPIVRAEALKSLFTVLGVGTTVLTLAKLNGIKVGLDSNSSDFGKIVVGNTRIDIWGGVQQYVRMASQLVTGKYVSSTTGKEYTLGEGYKPLTRWDILTRQLQSKESPILSFITDLLKQQDYTGKPVSVPKEVGKMFTPMLIGDAWDLAKDNPSLLPLTAFGAIGGSIQTYQPYKKPGAGFGGVSKKGSGFGKVSKTGKKGFGK